MEDLKIEDTQHTGCWVGSNLLAGKEAEMTIRKLPLEMGPGGLPGFGTGKQHVALV